MQSIQPLLQTDFYKVSHYKMYPDGTVEIYSNMCARKSRIPGVSKVVFFGLQYFIKEYLQKQWTENFFNKPKDEVVSEYRRFITATLGPGIDTRHIERLHDLQYLPLEIKALPEGSLVDIKVPFLTIRNTVDHAYWLVNYLESIISNILWKPITAATIAHEYRKLLDTYAAETSDTPEFVDWQGHDFHFRGGDGLESSCLTGAGHLLSFNGTDTIPAIRFLEDYYYANTMKELVGASVPATEHSVMCMGTKDDEISTFEALLKKYPEGILSVVSDTWDLWKVLTEFLPKLKDKILARNGKLVIRPDSGDPADILCGHKGFLSVNMQGRFLIPEQKGVVELLWDIFGGTINSKGFKVLDSHVGAIYGDSITLTNCPEICDRLEAKGFASTNVVFGIGSFTYQYTTRDTFGMAVKATHGKVIDYDKSELVAHGPGVSEWDIVIKSLDIYKDPITDDGTKKSAKGYLKVISVGTTNQITNKFTHDCYELIDQVSEQEEKEGELKTVFLDGELLITNSLQMIKHRLKSFK